jgi:hypothetical protein
MNDFKRLALVAAIIAGLAVIGFLSNSQQSTVRAQGGPTVTIDKTQLPLPVQGSLGVSGSVAATQSGTWNVGITGTPNVGLASGASVRIDNTVGDPVRVRNVNDAIQPFQAQATCNSTVNTCTTEIFDVPAGKRAVIEYFSGTANFGLGQTGIAYFQTTKAVFFVPSIPPQQGTLPATWGQQVRVYADTGAIDVTGDGNAGVTYQFSISGYLVDVPFTP